MSLGSEMEVGRCECMWRGGRLEVMEGGCEHVDPSTSHVGIRLLGSLGGGGFSGEVEGSGMTSALLRWEAGVGSAGAGRQ